jgi:hypothetical protein
VASRPELRPGGEKVEVGLLIDNEITFEPGVTYSLKEHGSRVVTHRAAKEIPMRITFAADALTGLKTPVRGYATALPDCLGLA